MEQENYFKKLNDINVNGKVESKNGLSFLSWAYAWAEVKKIFPDSTFVIYERETEFGPVNYFTDGRTCWVKTGVIINGIEHIEELPVMDYKNRSIALNDVTSFDVNKTIQRSLTKAVARHGLGLYIYAGEDLPESEADAKAAKAAEEAKKAEEAAKKASEPRSDGKPSLATLIKTIGETVKANMATPGYMDTYKSIITEVTGSATFKVNKATEENYDQVYSIYTKLTGK